MIAEALPAAHEPGCTEPVLTDGERTELEQCERALTIADAMFWAQGRAFAAIKAAQLHRENYASFEAYCAERWDTSARRANQLIEVAPLAEHLITAVGKTFPMININEAQTRALLPLAKRHGNAAATHVLEALVRIQQHERKGKITAALLTAVVDILPVDRFDRDDVAHHLADFMASKTRVLPAKRESTAPKPAKEYANELARVRSLVRRTSSAPQPERRKFARQLRALADELEQGAN